MINKRTVAYTPKMLGKIIGAVIVATMQIIAVAVDQKAKY